MLVFLKSLFKVNHGIAPAEIAEPRLERNDPDMASKHPVGYKVVPPPPPTPSPQE